MKNQSWVEKYRPKKLQFVRGHEDAIIKLKSAVQNKKPVLIYGPVGTGKTSTVYALANDLNYEILEVNASDFRNKDSINSTIGNSLNQMSLFSRGKVILIDEVDGISGNQDRGGVQAIVALLENPGHAIVMTCNDPWDQKLYSLRSKSNLIEFKRLNYLSLTNYLKEICEAEKIIYDLEDLKILARRCDGDLRSAIIDLENLTRWKGELNKDDINFLGEREKEESIFNAMKIIFKGNDINASLRSLDYVNMDLQESMMWLDENIPKEYGGIDLVRAYDNLAKADLFNGRIRRWQYYRFYVYMNSFITAGISLSKKEANPSFTQYSRVGRILKMWQAKMRYTKRRHIAEKISPIIHSSVKGTIKETIPYLQIMYKHKADFDFNLEEEEIEWLKK